MLSMVERLLNHPDTILLELETVKYSKISRQDLQHGFVNEEGQVSILHFSAYGKTTTGGCNNSVRTALD